MTELLIAVENNDIKAVKRLLDNGADAQAKDNCPIKLAADNGHIDIVKILIKNGAHVQADDNYAVRWASYGGHVDVVKILVKHGAGLPYGATDDCLKLIKDVMAEQEEMLLFNKQRLTIKTAMAKKPKIKAIKI